MTLRNRYWPRACLTLLVAAGLLLGIGPARAEEPDGFDMLREKWKELLTGGAGALSSDPDIADRREAVDDLAMARRGTMLTAPDRPCLWADLCSATDSSHITSAYARLKDMAVAYATPGSALEGDAALRNELLQALDWLAANRYNAASVAYNNWWDWQIGVPLRLNDIMVLMYDDLGNARIAEYAAAIERFSPAVGLTGANRVWKATVVALRGVVVKDAAKLSAARDGLSGVFGYVSSGDGFYADGSFIQHEKHPYTGGYGLSLLGDIANVLYLLEDSAWTVTDPNRSNVYRWVYDSFEPFLYKGAFMDMTRGREISRELYGDRYAGNKAVQAIIRLSQTAPASDAAAFRRLAKSAILADAKHFYATSSLYNAVLGKAIANDPSVVPEERTISKTFPAMNRTVHRNSAFAFGIAMFSNRVYNYESINNENVKGWYTGDGMTYLYDDDMTQYGDGYWATVDPYRLPGTTVDTRTRTNVSGASYLGSNAWAGGTSAGGAYGVAGMELDAWNSTLTARKSWFLFDDEVVALGAGISSSDGHPVRTIVENRKLNASGDNAFTLDGEARLPAPGASGAWTNVRWAHLEGNGEGAGIGYYFPAPASVSGDRLARTGSWSQINASGSSAPITRNYLALWVEHGANPAGAGYAYALLPGRSAGQVEQYAGDPDFSVLANTSSVQAVKENTLNVTGANFWTEAGGTAGIVSSSGKAAVAVRETATEIELSVSDPTAEGNGYIVLELDRAVSSKISADSGLYVTRFSPTVQLYADVRGKAGRSLSVRLSLTEPPSGPGTGLDDVPEPAGGTLFYDDFDDGTADGWTAESVPATGSTTACTAAHWTVASSPAGGYRYEAGNPTGECRSFINGGANWSDYSVEAKASAGQLSAGGSAPNLIARYNDALNYYRFGFGATDGSGGGNWKIYKRSAGVWSVLATGGPFVLDSNAEYGIKAELAGSSLKLYVDSGGGYELQASATDTAFGAGRVGLLTYKASASFDEVRVRSLSGE